MAKDLKAGDKVSWKSHGGEAASKDNPEFLVESDKSGGQAAHKSDAMKKI